MSLETRIMNRLDDLGIAYGRHTHAPVATVEEAKVYSCDVPGQHLKNLFLRDRKGKNHLLLVALEDQMVDLSKLGRLLGLSGLSFASKRRLDKYLGVSPGAVSPLPLLRDEAREVVLVLDGEIDRERDVSFHPGRNDVTLVLGFEDFLKYLEGLDITVHEISF